MTVPNSFTQDLFDSTELPNPGQFSDPSNFVSMAGDVDNWDPSDQTQDYANSLLSGSMSASQT